MTREKTRLLKEVKQAEAEYAEASRKLSGAFFTNNDKAFQEAKAELVIAHNKRKEARYWAVEQ